MKKSSNPILSEIANGMKAAVPIVLGFIPVGMAYAVMAKSAGFNVAETVFMSVSVFAGASQMMTVGLYKEGAALIAMVLATFMMNLRHVIMSTCVFEQTEKVGFFKKLFLGFFVTDESFAVITSRKGRKCTFGFFAALGVTHYLAWVAGTAIGAFAVGFLPKELELSLGIALYAMFIGLLVPGIKRNLKLFLLVCMAAVLNSVLSLFLSGAYSLIVTTLVCALAGVFFVDLDGDSKAEKEAQNEN